MDHIVVDFEVFAHGVVHQIVIGEVEKYELLHQNILEVIGFRSVNFYVGSDAASTVDGTARVGELDLAVGIALRAVRRVVEVVVHGDARVVARNQATAGGVVVICGQGESGVVRQR